MKTQVGEETIKGAILVLKLGKVDLFNLDLIVAHEPRQSFLGLSSIPSAISDTTKWRR
jgi:hypothetical protein